MNISPAMKRAAKVAKIGISIIYAFFCFTAVALSSAKDYEWWVEPVKAEFSYCHEPHIYDDTSDMAAPTLILILPLLAFGLYGLIKHRKFSLPLVLALGLLFYWTYSFFGRAIVC